MLSILPIPAQRVKPSPRSLPGLQGFAGSAVEVRWGNDGVGVINGPPGGFVSLHGAKKKLLPPTTTASCEGEGWGDRKLEEPHRFPTVRPPDHHRTTSTTERHGTNCHKTRVKPMNHHRPHYGRVIGADNGRARPRPGWCGHGRPRGVGGLMGRGLEARGGARRPGWYVGINRGTFGAWRGVSGPRRAIPV